jgi:hypothetical protein
VEALARPHPEDQQHEEAELAERLDAGAFALTRSNCRGASLDLIRSGLAADIATIEGIGKLVMEGLKGLDDVAYVRFASVYKDFREAKDFEELLGELSGEEENGGD